MTHPRRTAFVAGITAIASLMPALPTTAAAPAEDAADRVAAAVSDAAPSDVDAAPLTPVPEGLAAPLLGGGETVLATEPTDGVQVNTADGGVLAFSLPGAAELGDAAVAEDGSVTYPGGETTASVNVVAAPDAIRVSTVVENAAQAERFSYDFGAGAIIEIQDDGSAIAYLLQPVTSPETGETVEVEKIIANVAAPWAKDADGATVPTRYEASGSMLTQLVAHRSGDYAYPVVADPTIDRPNIFQYRARFNRAETSIIYQNGLGALGGFACGVMAPVCLLAAGSLVWNAGLAEKSRPKKCVQVTATQPYVVPGLVWWVDTYSGGPCR